MLYYDTLLLGIHQQVVSRVNTLEPRLAMVHIIVALTIITVKDTDGIHLLYLIVFIPDVDMLCNSLACSVQYTLQIIQLACQLHLYNYQMSLAVLGLYVNAIELVGVRFLIGFAFKQFDNLHILA